MAFLNEIRTRGEITSPGQVMDYLRQLEDQVRYALFNLDGQNIQEGAIGAEQLSGGVKTTIRTAQSTAEESGKDARKALQTADKNAKKITNLSRTVQALSLRVEEMSGSMAEMLDGSASFYFYAGSQRPDAENVIWIKIGETADPDGTYPCEVKYIPMNES